MQVHMRTAENTWGRFLQQHVLRKGNLREGFSLKFFLHFVFMKQKLVMFSFIISYLISKQILKFNLEMLSNLCIVVEYDPWIKGTICIPIRIVIDIFNLRLT